MTCGGDCNVHLGHKYNPSNPIPAEINIGWGLARPLVLAKERLTIVDVGDMSDTSGCQQ